MFGYVIICDPLCENQPYARGALGWFRREGHIIGKTNNLSLLNSGDAFNKPTLQLCELMRWKAESIKQGWGLQNILFSLSMIYSIIYHLSF